MNDTVKYILRFIALVLIQVLFLNNINFMGFINPLCYIYFIMVFPSSLNKDLLLLLGFGLGLTIDICCNTLGCHTFATTLIAYLKPYMQRFFGPNEEYEFAEPSFTSFGMASFLQYATTLTLIHHIAFFCVESMSLAHLGYLLFSIVATTFFTVFLIGVLQWCKRARQKK